MARVVHFEVHVEDPERAMNFYRTLFGWEFSKFPGPMDYWLINTGPKDTPGIDGGLMRRLGPIDGSAVTAYICTVNVDNLAASLEIATSHGATIALPTMPIPGVGWLAYIKEPEGNIVGMMQMDTTAA